MAQSQGVTPYALQKFESSASDARISGSAARDGGDIVFNEDFANGLAGNNGVGAWTVSGPNGNVWKHSLTGPRGAYTVTTQRINSATIANGYMLFCGDSVNSNLAVTPPVMNGDLELDGALESPVLDLSATPGVSLIYTQRLRWCCQATSPHAVQVSTDGGATWTSTFESASGISTNQDPGTQTREINISLAILADPSNVKIRFQHNPTASHYHWQIDDVQLVEMYTNELDLLDSYLTHTGTGEEYARIPANQVTTILAGGNVTNRGTAEQTGVTIDVNFNGGAMQTSIDGGTLPSLDTLAVEAEWTPTTLEPGVYTGAFTLSSDATDEIPTNNERSRWYEISTDYYALDGLSNPPDPDASDYTACGTASLPDLEDGLVYATYYELSAPLHIYGIEISLITPSSGFGTVTVAGGAISAMILDSSNVNFATPTIAPMPLPDLNTGLIDLVQADVDAGIMQFAFGGEAGVELPAGGYYAAVELYSNSQANNIVMFDDITVPQPGDATVVWDPTNDPPRWWSNGNAAAIRLLTSPLSIGVNEVNDPIGATLFPNPTAGEFALTLDKPGVYTVEVMDVLGQRVLNTRTVGERTDLDLSGHAAGVYTVRISDGADSTVKRVTVK